MNRDELAALARGTVYVLAGAAILGAFGLLVSWWVSTAIVVARMVGAAWDACRHPWWRLWR